MTEKLEKEAEKIKNRLSNIGEAIGNIALEYITEVERENAELKADNDARKFAMAMSEKVEKQLREENAELKEKISFLEDNLRVARKDRENLQLDVAKGLKEFVKDYPATSLRYLANEKYIEQLTKAKEIIKEYMRFEPMIGTCSFYSEEYEKTKEKAEAFLKECK